MKRKFLLTFIASAVLVIAAVIVLPQTLLKPKPIHIHAGFQVYKDNKLQDFSDVKYMHEIPCTIDGNPASGEHKDEQLEKAHLHDRTDDVVHVHRKGSKWGDLFTNIKYPLDKNVVAYSNGQKVDNFLNREIVAYESVVLFEGSHDDNAKYLKNTVKKAFIQQVEKKSETCGAS